MFGKSATSETHQSQPISGELFLESADAPTPMDLHNLDLMSDFLSSAPAMLGGPLFGGGNNGMSGPGMSMGMSLSMPLRQTSDSRPGQGQGPAEDDDDDYPGDLTASEAVKAVTQLLEASSRKLQKVTEEQQGGGTRGKDRAAEAPALMNVRLDKSGSQTAPRPTATIPEATTQAILQARGTQAAELDPDDSDIDAISVDGDVYAFDEDDDDEYYSDEEYDEDEDYDDEEGVLYLTDGEEESDYSHDGSDAESSCYDSEEEEEDGNEQQYPAAEIMPFHAPIRRKRNSHSTEQAAALPTGETSTPPRPHYSTIPYLPGSRRNPVTGKQMREILDRLSPAARHNYQQALIREHQLEIEMEKHGGEHHAQSAAAAAAPPQQPMLQSIPYPTPPQAEQARQPSVLDDPAVMASLNQSPMHGMLTHFSQDQAVDELFSWIKAVIWTIEQHAIRAARAQMEAKGVNSVAGAGKTEMLETQTPTSVPKGGGSMGSATWTPKATPDGERMRAMMRTVGIDVAPA